MPATALIAALVLAGPPGSAPRGNTVLDRDRARSFTAAAAGRYGWLAGGGSEFVQPHGFGFGATLGFHLLRMGAAPARFGLAFTGGHTRFLERRRFPAPDPAQGDEPLERVTVLSHTDLALGPSFEIVGGPLVVLVGGGVGVGVDQLVRPITADPRQDQQAVAGDLLLRGGLSLGIPIVNNHGLAVGGAVQKYFSGVRRAPAPLDPERADARSVVFDLVIEVHLAYQAWF